MFFRFSPVLFGLFAVNVLASPAPVEERQALDLTGLVQRVDIFVTQKSNDQNLVDVQVTATNPTSEELSLESISTTAVRKNTETVVYFELTHDFVPPLVVPALGEQQSEKIVDVLLTRGILGTVELVELGTLDLKNTSVVVSVGGESVAVNVPDQGNVGAV
ncbi:hypothetical protein Moror_1189 [Moniliophthora roreri MCA 2997]|uniref:Late embryogenesis abundant protein LEA-2 subgroup domain-containing protein n=2 Tax=Moniliophthora roreri TaxID=221103 RepID=V2XAZ9_MONRO|nr:hypothetical protein Moror_1189 [Moniliophthora roreri MCA 2997]